MNAIRKERVIKDWTKNLSDEDKAILDGLTEKQLELFDSWIKDGDSPQEALDSIKEQINAN